MPDWAREVRTRLASVRLSPTREAEIVNELAQHLQDRYDELRRRWHAARGGHAASRSTRSRAARRWRPGWPRCDRRTRRSRPYPAAPTGAVLTDLWQDVRAARRQFVQQPGYAAVVVATLAVCLAANLAIFAVVDGVVLRPLPFPDADRLVAIYNTYPGAGRDIAPSSGADFFDRQALPALEGLATYQRLGLTLGRDDDAPERAAGLVASPSLFALIGTQPLLGRLLVDADAEPGAEQKVVLTYGYWQRAFGAQDSAVGATLHVNGAPFTVVGVLPERWRFIDPALEVVIPAAFPQAARAPMRRHSDNNWRQVARLAPGATLETLQSQLDALNARNVEQTPALRQTLIDMRIFTTRVRPLQRSWPGRGEHLLPIVGRRRWWSC